MAGLPFNSRRSSIYATGGMAASSQPLATEIGLRVLQGGGNAADAAVAMAAALNVTEPCSTGIGGDCFCLFYDAKEKKVHGMNGSGRTPEKMTIDYARAQGITSDELPHTSVMTVTVPGAAAGWVDTIEKFGTQTLAEVLQPAIDLAEHGFPVHTIAAQGWKNGAHLLTADNNPHGKDMLLPDGHAPKEGQVMKLPKLAATFRRLATEGRDGFYKGAVAQAIVDVITAGGGCMTLRDLENHVTTFEDPISVNYRGVDVYEIAPNGQGLTALMALNILEGFDVSNFGHNSVQYLHHVIEALRLSFADTQWFVTDPTKFDIPLEGMLSKAYAAARRDTIRADKCTADVVRGSPGDYSDTVYFTTVDKDGNACSFINSNYMGFGTGLVPENGGFTLQNRGCKMPLDAHHPNHLEGNKRPYHTIIPGMALRNGELYSTFGVMGGYMQPQGHAQVLMNMIDFGMSPQAALDAPRVCVGPGHTGTGGSVHLEEGVLQETVDTLRQMGHDISHESPVCGFARSVFGRGQIINRIADPAATRGHVFVAGSDPRADGCALGQQCTE
eukprot:m.217381 g.217381  ORF g.217381 m.217381 type:complete len:557 (+) comp19125_c0_seq1:156-1826(+)